MSNTVVSTTSGAISSIASELNIDPQIVEEVINALVIRVRTAIRAEVPFQLRGLGKFYLRYGDKANAKARMSPDSYLQDKVLREVRFTACDEWKSEANMWVHDFGIKNNTKKELMRLKIRPDELDKMRKKKILEDQRTLGFRSDLLFDDVSQTDKTFEDTLGRAPTADEIMRRIGINLED